MWFADDPWPTVIALALAAGVLTVWGVVTGRAKFLFGAGACVLLGAAVWGVAAAVVTESERVENRVRELADAVVAGDADRAVGFFTEDAVASRLQVRAGLALADVGDDLRLTDWQTTVGDGGTAATCHFRANATFSLASRGFSARQPTRWETRWVRSPDGVWRIAGVTRLDVITGEAKGMLDAE